MKCNPPECLLKYMAPLYVGMEPKDVSKAKKEDAQNSQLDDMLNSMLPPRCVLTRELRMNSGGAFTCASKDGIFELLTWTCRLARGIFVSIFFGAGG